MKTRFYYTFQEIINKTSTEPIISDIGFYEVLDSLLGISSDTDTAFTKMLFQYYINPTLSDKFVDYADVEHEEYEEVSKPDISHSVLITSMYVLLKKTQEYYEERISRLEEYRDQLMKEVANKTIAKFNDTPQIKNQDLSTDEYVSNISTSEVQSEPGSMADRLENANNAIKRYYENWAYEFTSKFILWVEEETWTRK